MRSLLLIAVLITTAIPESAAQYPWPVTPLHDSHEITGTFSEYRDTQPSPHFHNAVDIPKADRSPVYAVETGTVSGFGSDWIRVGNFAYVHVEPSPALAIGDTAYVSETIVGTILDGYGHVHLTDGQPGSERQPLREGGLTPFVDDWAPTIDNIRFYHQPTRQRLATTELTGDVEITFRVSEANGPPTTSVSRLNNGAYLVGYKVLTRDRLDEVHVPPDDGVRFRFDTKPSNTYVHNVFDPLQSSNASHVYIVTNDVTQEAAWDTRVLDEGEYTVMLFAEDTRGNRDEVFVDVAVSQRDILPPPTPTLTSVVREADEMLVTWTGGDADDLAAFRLYRGDAPVGTFEQWPLGASIDDTHRDFATPPPDGPAFFRLTAVDEEAPPNESDHGDVYGFYEGSGDVRLLIVDGFDRSGGSGSWQQPWHHFAGVHGAALAEAGVGFETAANEAIESGAVDLAEYDAVIWLLGDESTADETFSSIEQAHVRSYLEDGGYLFVSGSEIAWDLDNRGSSADKAFISQYLKVTYAGDDAGSLSVEGVGGSAFDGASFTYGTTPYPEDYPDYFDAVQGGEAVLQYSNGRTAGVAYEGPFKDGGEVGKVLVLGLPFETISGTRTRDAVMERVLSFFFPQGVASEREQLLATSPLLHPVYPNPARGDVHLTFDLPGAAPVSLEVFDALGRRVERLVHGDRTAGRHLINWKADVSAGVYFVRMRTGGFTTTQRVTIMR